jgi:hypothetical protein
METSDQLHLSASLSEYFYGAEESYTFRGLNWNRSTSRPATILTELSRLIPFLMKHRRLVVSTVLHTEES